MAKNTHDFKPIEGKYVNLREVTIDDAAFILQLRTTGKAVKFLHKTENNLQKQIDYIKRYLTLDNEYYFIIERKDGTPLGTVSIYNIHEDEFTSGRWCMVEHSLPEEVLESSILEWNYAFNVLNLRKDYYDVRKNNKKVLRYHEIWGTRYIKEGKEDIFFEMTRDMFNQNKQRFLDLL